MAQPESPGPRTDRGRRRRRPTARKMCSSSSATTPPMYYTEESATVATGTNTFEEASEDATSTRRGARKVGSNVNSDQKPLQESNYAEKKGILKQSSSGNGDSRGRRRPEGSRNPRDECQSEATFCASWLKSADWPKSANLLKSTRIKHDPESSARSCRAGNTRTGQTSCKQHSFDD